LWWWAFWTCSEGDDADEVEQAKGLQASVSWRGQGLRCLSVTFFKRNLDSQDSTLPMTHMSCTFLKLMLL